MGELGALPDDIVSHIFSFLTPRDAVRVRSLLFRWKDLPDCRTVLVFDSSTIFGKDKCHSLKGPFKSTFVNAVSQFLDIWKGQNLRALKVAFELGNEHTSHIDGWIASLPKKDIENLELRFSSDSYGGGKYVFPCHLLDFGNNSSYLKHLRLKCCELKMPSYGCTTWLGQLATLELTGVTISGSDILFILSHCLNLESFSMIPDYLDVSLAEKHLPIRHSNLKKLNILDDYLHVEVDCPHLEMFKFGGRGNFTLVHVPLLKEVGLTHYHKVGGCSSIFGNFTRCAPQLHVLSLLVVTEVPPLCASISMSRLKKLDLHTRIPDGFDLFTLTHILYASPLLETLHLKLTPALFKRQNPRRQYSDRPHDQLKEVKMEGLSWRWNVMEFAEYLLKNAVVLERMIFDVNIEKLTSHMKTHLKAPPKFTKFFKIKQNANSSAELIFL